ncbi:MAG: glutamate--cysteine ligase [Flavobacteriales bacterium]|nr:glutamate--cysteine ligase [Flavobacteriales bacterium]
MKKLSDYSDFSAFKSMDPVSQIGLEKESLRVDNKGISKKPHPISLGSSLFNKFITTDFSESQLEIVTPPFQDKEKMINFLDDIHHFISAKIDDELIWPFSIPMAIDSNCKIPIAEYGTSNLAKLKHIYRKGLANRYSREMQIISGLHFNFSLSKPTIEAIFLNHDLDAYEYEKSDTYLRALRNNFRYNWLILYLFGASPILSKDLVSSTDSFKKLGNRYYYLEHATSLRMSKYGYKNSERESLKVSLNSLEEYIRDLREAAKTESKQFKHFEDSNRMFENQLNSNILQIEDEYYAIARVKSTSTALKPLSAKLEKNGIDFIELRSLDLDPFSPVGVKLETIYFLEVYMWYCFLTKSDPIANDEHEEIDQNEYLVALYGRRPDLKLTKQGKKIQLSTWSNEIFDDLYLIAENLDKQDTHYVDAINNFKSMIKDPDQTISARIIRDSAGRKNGFEELGFTISENYKDAYKSIKIQKNPTNTLFESEVENSIIKQRDLENSDEPPFEEFLNNYLKNLN